MNNKIYGQIKLNKFQGQNRLNKRQVESEQEKGFKNKWLTEIGNIASAIKTNGELKQNKSQNKTAYGNKNNVNK